MAKQKASTGPLTEQHLKLLDRILLACKETEEYCKKCEACNLDVDTELKQTRDTAETAAKIKRQFFPDAR